jgi:hypothetical protein
MAVRLGGYATIQIRSHYAAMSNRLSRSRQSGEFPRFGQPLPFERRNLDAEVLIIAAKDENLGSSNSQIHWDSVL